MGNLTIGAPSATASGSMILLDIISGNLLQLLNSLDDLGGRRTPRKPILTPLTLIPQLLLLLLPILLPTKQILMMMAFRSMVAYAELLT